MSNRSDLHSETMNSNQQTNPNAAGSSPVGSRYTRRQAIDDGALMDVSPYASLLKIELPVFLTARAHARCILEPYGLEDLPKHLLKFLWLLRYGFRRAICEGVGAKVITGGPVVSSLAGIIEKLAKSGTRKPDPMDDVLLIIRHETFDVDDPSPVLVVYLQGETQESTQPRR